MTSKMIKALSKCWDKGIKIYPIPIDETYYVGKRQIQKCKIVIETGNKKNIGTGVYKQDETLYKKIEELYSHYSLKF